MSEPPAGSDPDRPSPDPGTPGDPAVRELDYRTFRRLTFYGVLGGLCPLVPVPFLDDWLLARVRGWMVAELGPRRAPGLSEESVAILAGRRDAQGWPGCVGGCLWALQKVTVKLLVKLFRKLVYFLAVRDGIQAATLLVQEGYLTLEALGHDLFRQDLPAGGQEAAARRLRTAVLATLEGSDIRPVRQAVGRIFRGSRALLVRAARLLVRPFLRRGARRRAEAGPAEETAAAETLDREEELLGGLVDRLAASLWGNREHFRRLARDLESRLEGTAVEGEEAWTAEPPGP